MQGKPVVRVRLLGPVDVTVEGEPVHLSGVRRKAVLATLALHQGEPVSMERIIDVVWGAEPPASVVNVLQNTVSHLRDLVGDRSWIVGGIKGYALRLPGEAIDVAVAESLIGSLRPAHDPYEQATRLGAALKLWRGRSLVDVADVPGLAPYAQRLEELRTDASVLLIDARLGQGEHAYLVSGLQKAVQANPFREDLHRQLMLALYRCGRQSDALAVYRRLRRDMLDELGIEPAAALRELEGAILRQDARLDLAGPAWVAPGPVDQADDALLPAQLPPTLGTFTARSAELAQLDAVLAAGTEGNARPVIISGTAGVGKTSLAVRWATSVVAAYPDGQLHVDLRGFDPIGQAMQPSEVLRRFLRSMGVPARDIPPTLDEQAALYRTVLAGRRILILLDNARDEDQVRPLLPGSREALVLVTSRNRLTGLVVAEGARTVALDLPSKAEAEEILVRRLGAERVAAEPGAVDDIIARCARLPLAVAVAAARAATDPALSLAAVAEQLSDGVSPLAPFHGQGDTRTDVRAVFSWSYRALSAPAARLFRLLGVCPTSPDFSMAGLISLAGVPAREARSLLDELIRMNLLTQLSPERFGCHDLLRAFATEEAIRTDRPEERSASLQRLLEHYLHTAYAASSRYQQPRDPVDLPPAHPGVRVVDLSDRTAATAWFDRELPALLAAVRLTPPSSTWRPWQLAWALNNYLDRQGHWSCYAINHRCALRAAQQAGDVLGRAYAHLHLSRASRMLRRMAEAAEHRERAIAAFRQLDDPIGHARALLDGALAAHDEERFLDAVILCEEALELYRSARFRSGEGHALNHLAWSLLLVGRFDEGVARAEQGLALHQQDGDRKAQADTWDTLGHLHFRLGDAHRGSDCYDRSVTLYQELGDTYNEADSLAALGNDQATAGDLDAAYRSWRQATDLLTELSKTDADTIRRKLPAVVTAGEACAA